MSATQPAAADGVAVPAAAGTAAGADSATEGTPAAPPPPPPSIPELEAEITARRERLAQTIDELAFRVSPKTILNRQAEAAKARFADVATTPEGDLRVERIAAVVAVVAVVGGWLIYRRLRSS